MAKQLYSFLPDIQYPELVRVNVSTGEIISSESKYPGHFSFVWPNGVPCIAVEMFLQEKAKEVKVSKKDGGTVGVYASHLTHLVRYCFNAELNFWELLHSNIDELVYNLASETNELNVRVRDNNTIKSIISRCVTFLEWFQENIILDRNIVGINTKEKRFQIRVKEAIYSSPSGRKVTYRVFPHKLPNSTSRAKAPISTRAVKDLWNTLANSKSEAKCSRMLQGKYTGPEQAEHIEYMYKRRELQLILLEATGLRPQELITINASRNKKYLESSQIIIPTLKRRNNPRDNERVIPIPREIAMKIEVFIAVHRKKLIKRLIHAGIVDSENEIDDVIYLGSDNGKEVSPDAAYQEFRRLTKKAGIRQKNCQSMFRHRFITNMVKLHLVAFMDKNPLKNRQIITDSDYRTILTKVTKFTGHRNVESLMHYIDIAWDELGAFSYTYEIKELQDKLKMIFYTTNALKAEVEKEKSKSNQSKVILEKIAIKLTELEDIAISI